jgi:hypothetical protein
MTRVAINRCFGGFGITDEAFEKLLQRKGIAFDKVEKKDSAFIGASYYQAGHAGDDAYYISSYDHYNDRSDPDLIAVIEEMGQSSWGWAAEIGIVEIPDDVEWFISEYDGIEHVAEKHRTWS